MTVARSRQRPAGTVGGRIPCRKMPRSKSAAAAAMVGAGSPVRTGTIWVVLPSRSQPAAASSALKRRRFSSNWRRRSAPSAPATISSAASAAAGTAGGRLVEKMKGRLRLMRISITGRGAAR